MEKKLIRIIILILGMKNSVNIRISLVTYGQRSVYHNIQFL